MANTPSEASVISVPQVVQPDRVSDWTRFAHDHSLAEPLRLVSGKELVTAIEEKNEQDNVSEVRSTKRWRALDQLLRVSFELISPAYLFNSFPQSDSGNLVKEGRRKRRFSSYRRTEP